MGAGPANAVPAPASARAVLESRLVPHSAVGVDPASGQVVLTIADAATGTDGLVSAARRYGSGVRIERVPGRFGTMEGHFRGGNGIFDPNLGTCTLGFNVTGGFAVTAGHCAGPGTYWYKENNGLPIGPAVGSSFPGDDFGLIRNDGEMRQRGDVQAYDAGIQDITGAATPSAGQSVCKSGRTTQRTCGTVLRTDVTVNYPQGAVFGLVETNLCAAPGDSGGPLYAGSTALGLTSGGTLGLPCSNSGFRSFYQPVAEALNVFGVSVF
ncbi:MAG TPA: S1 family peptidase [Pseudonocardiaceae bacterium]|nr:S1 family peptidase [Pseudonocardiaceae bacterium]